MYLSQIIGKTIKSKRGKMFSNKIKILIAVLLIIILSTLHYVLKDENDIIDNYDFPISENHYNGPKELTHNQKNKLE